MGSDYEHLVGAGHDPEVAKRWANEIKQDRERQAQEQSDLHDATIRKSIERGRTKSEGDASSGLPLLLIVCLLMVYFGYLILSGDESWWG